MLRVIQIGFGQWPETDGTSGSVVVAPSDYGMPAQANLLRTLEQTNEVMLSRLESGRYFPGQWQWDGIKLWDIHHLCWSW